MEKQTKIFCGSGKVVTTKFGDMTKISFSQKDLDTLQSNMVNGWINLVLKEKKEKVEGKPTHYLEVDTWKPTPKVGGSNFQKPTHIEPTFGRPDNSELNYLPF